MEGAPAEGALSLLDVGERKIDANDERAAFDARLADCLRHLRQSRKAVLNRVDVPRTVHGEETALRGMMRLARAASRAPSVGTMPTKQT